MCMLQEDLFDARCELFPVSIQLISADNGALRDQSKQLTQDIEFIDQVRNSHQPNLPRQ